MSVVAHKNRRSIQYLIFLIFDRDSAHGAHSDFGNVQVGGDLGSSEGLNAAHFPGMPVRCIFGLEVDAG